MEIIRDCVLSLGHVGAGKDGKSEGGGTNDAASAEALFLSLRGVNGRKEMSLGIPPVELGILSGPVVLPDEHVFNSVHLQPDTKFKEGILLPDSLVLGVGDGVGPHLAGLLEHRAKDVAASWVAKLNRILSQDSIRISRRFAVLLVAILNIICAIAVPLKGVAHIFAIIVEINGNPSEFTIVAAELDRLGKSCGVHDMNAVSDSVGLVDVETVVACKVRVVSTIISDLNIGPFVFHGLIMFLNLFFVVVRIGPGSFGKHIKAISVIIPEGLSPPLCLQVDVRAEPQVS